MMRQMIAATGNAEKMVEIRQILAGSGIELETMKDAGLELEIVENGSTCAVTNTYAVTPKTAVIPVTKNLTTTTEDGKGHTFTFTLTAKDGAPMPDATADATREIGYAAGKTGTKDRKSVV